MLRVVILTAVWSVIGIVAVAAGTIGLAVELLGDGARAFRRWHERRKMERHYIKWWQGW